MKVCVGTIRTIGGADVKIFLATTEEKLLKVLKKRMPDVGSKYYKSQQNFNF